MKLYRLTMKNVKERMLKINPNIQILTEEYTNSKTKIEAKCLIDSYTWSVTPNGLLSGYGCPKCAIKKRANKMRLTIETVKERIYKTNKNILIISDNYVNCYSKIKCKCLLDNHIWESTADNLLAGHGCPACSNRCSHEGNSLKFKRPDLVKYLQDKKDSLLAYASNKKIKTNCPLCGMNKKKTMCVATLSTYGFSCDFCNDGISLPEKFFANVLNQINISFEKEYSPKWSCGKRYDFYIPDKNIIIETHGGFHYKDTRMTKKKSVEENDIFKKNLAYKNGIIKENYITIDCRKSDFSWLKEQGEKELSRAFDVSNINWQSAWTLCQKSLLTEICESWNIRSPCETTSFFANKYKLSTVTILNYLKRGTEIGICNYDPMIENIMKGKSRGKKVFQYKEDGTLIRVFCSIREASMETGISSYNISSCCTGKFETAQGFVWRYEPLIVDS